MIKMYHIFLCRCYLIISSNDLALTEPHPQGILRAPEPSPRATDAQLLVLLHAPRRRSLHRLFTSSAMFSVGLGCYLHESATSLSMSLIGAKSLLTTSMLLSTFVTGMVHEV